MRASLRYDSVYDRVIETMHIPRLIVMIGTINEWARTFMTFELEIVDYFGG